DMLETERVTTFMEKGSIEIAPLAYMRGRTLNDSFIILDEAQNSTAEQMKMFLTRLGFNSKMVITGDVTQVDLPASRGSGLIEVQSVLRGVPGIRFVYFDDGDMVRHQLVSAIVRAYDAHDARKGERESTPAPSCGLQRSRIASVGLPCHRRASRGPPTGPSPLSCARQST